MNGTFLPTALLSVHVLANVVWIGALLGVTRILARASLTKDPAGASGIARDVHLRLAVPAFLASFGAGLLRILLAPAAYAHMPWFHAKLTFALAVIVIHHIIGARAKRAASGTAGASAAAGGMSTLGALTFAAAAGAVFLGIAKSLP